MDEITTSPTPPYNIVQELSFLDAIREVMNGHRITRIDWADDSIYGELKDGYLMLHKDNEYFQWIISDGDMQAIDWIVL